MKSRTVIILWVIAIILGISIFFVKKSQNSGQERSTARSPGQTLIENFPADEVASIEISGINETTTLQEKDGEWTVTQRDDYPANTRNINDLLRTLSELKVTQGIEAGPSAAPNFGMDEKSSEPEKHGITAVFKDASGNELSTLTFGKNLDAAGSQSPFGGGATGRFVRNHADDSGFYAVSEVFGILSTDPKDWLSDEFFKVEKIKTISLTKPGSDDNEWTITREDEEAEFAFAEAFPGVKIDPAATGPLKSLFSFARFDDLVPASEIEKRATPDQLQTTVITTFEGLEYTLAIQPAKPAEGAEESAQKTYLMTVTISGDLPKERKKPEEETEEDAKKADVAFNQRITALTENLEQTKTLEGRTFEVGNNTVASLLKSRTDLMLKTPAPAAAPPPSPPGASAFTQPIEIPARPAPAPPEVQEAPEGRKATPHHARARASNGKRISISLHHRQPVRHTLTY